MKREYFSPNIELCLIEISAMKAIAAASAFGNCENQNFVTDQEEVWW